MPVVLDPETPQATTSRQPRSAGAGGLRTELVGCCVCGGSRHTVIARGFDFEYETTREEFPVVRCDDCGHHFLNPRPAESELPAIYPPNYYAYQYQDAVHPLARRAKDFLDRRKIRGWLAPCTTSAPRFLDVGCGDGRYLRMFAERGVARSALWGVEMSREVVDGLVAEGFQGRFGRIEDAQDLPQNYFDLIVMLQVIEHVSEPGACVARLAQLLAPGGVLVLETPNVDALDVRLFQSRYWGGYHLPRHWNLFSPESLRKLLLRHGLEPVATRFLPSPAFWLHSLHHWLKYERRQPRLARWVHPARCVPGLAAFTAFDMFRAALRRRTSNMQLMARRP